MNYEYIPIMEYVQQPRVESIPIVSETVVPDYQHAEWGFVSLPLVRLPLARLPLPVFPLPQSGCSDVIVGVMRARTQSDGWMCLQVCAAAGTERGIDLSQLCAVHQQKVRFSLFPSPRNRCPAFFPRRSFSMP